MTDDIVYNEDLEEWVLIPRWATVVERTAAECLTDREKMDDLFSCAINFMWDSLVMPGCFLPDEIDKAADSAMQFALKEGDRLAWEKLLEVYSAFVAHHLPPPMPLQSGLVDVFKTFGSGYGYTMDDAFGLSKSKPGRPNGMYQLRNREKCNAIAVCWWMVKLETTKVQPAAKKWAEIQDLSRGKSDSVSTIKQDYDKYKNSDWLAELEQRYRLRK